MQHKAAQGTKWQDLINKALTRLEAPGLRPQSACLEEMQEDELRMLSTDTNTISTTLPSPPLPQPASQRHPHTNHCEDTLQSQASLGQAAHWEELFLLSQPRQRCLCKQPVHRTSTRTLLGSSTPASICSAPSTRSAQSTALGWLLPWSHPGSCSHSPEHSCSPQSPTMAHSLSQTFC